MMDKRTEELIHELKECRQIERFIEDNDQQFEQGSLADYIAALMERKGIKKIDVVKRSRLSEVYTYQILAGMKNPDREKLLCIIFGLELNLQEANRVLKMGGKAELYPKKRRDSVIIFALNKGLSLDDTNDLLYELGEETLS